MAESEETIGCRNRESFDKNLKAIAAKNCLSCHQTGTGKNRMPLTEDTMCDEFSERLDRKIWGRSLLLDYSISLYDGHAKIPTEADQKMFVEKFKAWANNQ